MRVLIGLVVVLFTATPALACGEWHMLDKERSLDVDYLINAARIKKGDKNVASIYLDVDDKQPLRVVRDKKVVFDIKGGKLLKLGAVVGTLNDGTLTIGKKKFTIELTGDAGLFDADPLPAPGFRELTVRAGDKIVITGENVYTLCRSTGTPREEITRRVAFYLAWRELGG